jgi:hypothetical protein
MDGKFASGIATLRSQMATALVCERLQHNQAEPDKRTMLV